MRTALFLIAGLLLLGAALLLGRLFSSHYPGATFVATIAYVALWLIIAGANMWVGVAKAGYSVTEELPIFLLIFGVPAAAAILLKWRLL
ncbi:MAG: hypothetical protein E6H49_02965 [Betaproteobacteria bacterium]|nr:MAG: hypothetical protein E6H56_15730 [Betaproteobacteria bacterium]TMH83174.1 MAG: hypothetical protein E6H49_02965 [Betaproteobacteria bacterium]